MMVSASISCPGNHFSTNVSATTSLAFSAMTAASNGASGGNAGWGYRSLASSACGDWAGPALPRQDGRLRAPATLPLPVSAGTWRGQPDVLDQRTGAVDDLSRTF